VKLFCFGFGQVARYFVKKLSLEKKNFRLITTNTKKTLDLKFQNIKFKSYFFSNYAYDKKIISGLENATHILISIPPKNYKDLVLESFKKILYQQRKIKWIGYLSSTSVYGNHHGKYVSEDSILLTNTKVGINRIIAENEWLHLFKFYDLPVRVFRLSGIYSNETNVLERIIRNDLNILKFKDQYISRIHVEDIANIIFKSLKFSKSGEIYNVSDNKPSRYSDVVKYGCKLLNVSYKSLINKKNFKSSNVNVFFKDSKKVSNKKIMFNFKLKLKYPSYKEGLNSIFNNFYN